ncbi:unnamed protein product [Agarophyton chilense]
MGRPHTRQWQRLLVDATSQRAHAADTRAALRSHLAAAERLHKRRTQVTLRRHARQLRCASTSWDVKRAALQALSAATDPQLLRAVAPLLGPLLTDLRSSLVLAASRCVQRVARFLAPEDAADVMMCAVGGVHDAKKILAEARTAAALALAAHTRDHAFWMKVVAAVRSPRPQARALVLLAAAKALVPNATAAEHRRTLHAVVVPLLDATAHDKHPAVRQAARNLLNAYTSAFGSAATVDLLKQLPHAASDRLQLAAAPPVAPQRPSLKQLIHHKRQAMRHQQPNRTTATTVATNTIATNTIATTADLHQKLLTKHVAATDQENIQTHTSTS